MDGSAPAPCIASASPLQRVYYTWVCLRINENERVGGGGVRVAVHPPPRQTINPIRMRQPSHHVIYRWLRWQARGTQWLSCYIGYVCQRACKTYYPRSFGLWGATSTAALEELSNLKPAVLSGTLPVGWSSLTATCKADIQSTCPVITKHSTLTQINRRPHD